MSNARSSRRDAIRKALAIRAGDAPDPSAVAEANLSTWHQVVAQLAPVIGARGVDVLVGRSLHLTRARLSWFALALDDANKTDTLESFQERLRERDTAVATEASFVLLVQFTELLATLIGEPLTDRLLSPVWTPQPVYENEKEITT
jgi:hypothetical protein